MQLPLASAIDEIGVRATHLILSATHHGVSGNTLVKIEYLGISSLVKSVHTVVLQRLQGRLSTDLEEDPTSHRSALWPSADVINDISPHTEAYI